MKGDWMIEEMRAMASWEDLNPKQLAYFKKMVEDARVVECVPLSEVFTKAELAYIRKNLRPKVNECYRNSTRLCELFMGSQVHTVTYVEGFSETAGVIRIEHAWCCVDGRYVDPTFELLFKDDVRERGYVSLVEMTLHDLLGFQLESGYYGDTYRLKYLKSLQDAKVQ